jgi:hypothetical protein
MNVHVHQAGQPPATVADAVRLGHWLFAEHAAVNEQGAFFPFWQDDPGDAEHHEGCLSGSPASAHPAGN